MDTLKLQLSSCTTHESYYVHALRKAGKSNHAASITKIIIEVELGVDYNDLSEVLLSFPNLEILQLSQHHSCGECIALDDLLQCLEVLALHEFILYDQKSEFLKDIDQSLLFDKLPPNCKYTIVYGNNIVNTTHHIHPKVDKYMLFTC